MAATREDRFYGVGLYGVGRYGTGDPIQVYPSLFTDRRGNRLPEKRLFFPPTKIR